jgi:adenine-specific DNA methylase
MRQVGVQPEQVAEGIAVPEPRCRHAWEVRAEQKWLWRISVSCRRCGYGLPLPGRWWRERDVRQVVDETLRRMEAETAASWAAEQGPGAAQPPD